MYNSKKPSDDALPTTGELLRSTLFAMATAAVLLVTVVLPAEYGIDPTGIGRMLQLTKMGTIKQQLSREATEADQTSTQKIANKSRAGSGGKKASEVNQAATKVQQPRTDSLTLILQPGKGAEIKMQMREGAKATYEWRAEGGLVYFDKHGDGAEGSEFSYEKAANAKARQGSLIAKFNGIHGWYWSNRGDSPVTITLQTKGAYSVIAKM